jgi:hypothetical protein
MESIDVIATFTTKGLVPHVIKWGKHRYKITTVNLVHAIKDGAVRIYFFSVSDGANSWKLGFNTETLKWWIEDASLS